MNSYKLEDYILYLLKNEPLYGFFLMNSKKINTDKIATAGVSYDKLDLDLKFYFNMEFLNQFTLAQGAAILKHEVSHIIQKAFERGKRLNLQKGYEYKVFNQALDLAVNQQIRDIPHKGMIAGKEAKFCTLETMKEKFPNLEANQTAEQYYKILMEKYKSEADAAEFELMDDHSGLEEIEVDDVVGQIIKERLIDSAKKAKEVGNISLNDELLLNNALKSRVNWKQRLHNFVNNADETRKIRLRSRRNRRYGLTFPGEKKERKFHLAVAVDTSGSCADKIDEFFVEIGKIASLGHKVTVMTCDSEVKDVFIYDKKKLPKIHGGGGTLYNPVMIKTKEEIKPDALIYFGDMDCFDEKDIQNPACPLLWVITGQQKQPTKFGKSLYLEP